MTRRGHKGLTVRLFSSLSMIEDGMNPAELARSEASPSRP